MLNRIHGWKICRSSRLYLDFFLSHATQMLFEEYIHLRNSASLRRSRCCCCCVSKPMLLPIKSAGAMQPAHPCAAWMTARAQVCCEFVLFELCVPRGHVVEGLRPREYSPRGEISYLSRFLSEMPATFATSDSLYLPIKERNCPGTVGRHLLSCLRLPLVLCVLVMTAV